MAVFVEVSVLINHRTLFSFPNGSHFFQAQWPFLIPEITLASPYTICDTFLFCFSFFVFFPIFCGFRLSEIPKSMLEFGGRLGPYRSP